MNLQVNILTVSIVLTFGISQVSSLKCHVCSTGNPGQEDCEAIAEGNTKYLMECFHPLNATCRIQEQWIDFEVLNQKTDKRTIRQCASTEYDASRPCYYRTGFGGRINVCNCESDGCNEAARTASTLLMTIGLVLFVKYLAH
ncbi:hypothetical protein X975_17113, partial [Stegodyphus mimosarum]